MADTTGALAEEPFDEEREYYWDAAWLAFKLRFATRHSVGHAGKRLIQILHQQSRNSVSAGSNIGECMIAFGMDLDDWPHLLAAAKRDRNHD